MPSWIKLGLGLLLTLPLVIFGAAAIAPLLIDQQRLLTDLEAEISLSLGRPTQVDSIALLQFFPFPRLRLEGLRIAESVAADAQTIATIEAVQLDAALWPLISGRLVLAEVLLDRPKVRLPLAPMAIPSASSEPESNLESKLEQALALTSELKPEQALALTPELVPEPMPDLQLSSGSTPAAWPPIRRLLILDAELAGPTQSVDAGAALSLGDLNLTAGPIRPGSSGRLDATFRVFAQAAQARQAAPAERESFALPGLVEAEIRLADARHALELRPLRLRFGTSAGGQGPPIEVDAAALIDLIHARARFEPVELSIDRLRARGAAQVFPTASGLGIDAQLRVPPFDLRTWLVEQAALRMPGNRDSLRRVSGQSDLQLRGSVLAINHAAFSIDQAQLRAVARLRLPEAPSVPFSGQLALAIDRLDLDPYLRAAATVNVAPASSPPFPALPPLPALPPETGPTEQGLRLQLAAGELRLGGLGFSAVRLGGRLQPQALELDASAGFYGGWLQTELNARPLDVFASDQQPWLEPGSPPADDRASRPALRLEATAGDVDVAALLAALQLGGHKQAPMTGRGEIELDLMAQGASPALITSTLGGKVVFAVRHGAVTIVDLEQLITGTIGAFGVSREDAENLTRFSAFSLSATGEEGRFDSEDIQLRSNLLHIDGVGQLDLPTQQLALDLSAVLTKPPQGRAIKELEGIPIPIKARGPWLDPRWEVDTKAALNQAARRALREDSGLFDKLEERTGIQGLGDGLRQILPGLLGQ
ncbi:MAG: AsmA family protein [Lamprobacter sp.]|uniref:AsmA family protein n=1 Tax=Lamprobacter sp. TaxID=3100796 RepID=UPI002B260BCF|nr:AsmA family protein [Lamprobacter sp.]MEA3639276.1 AsmA family protein [Lamprobacter sp.]